MWTKHMCQYLVGEKTLAETVVTVIVELIIRVFEFLNPAVARRSVEEKLAASVGKMVVAAEREMATRLILGLTHRVANTLPM